MDINIRLENPTDIAHIHRITEQAFFNAAHTAHTEQFIIKALRDANALAISQIAEINGNIVAHVAVSPVKISDGTPNWYGLGPISVMPEYQRRGIGSRLIQATLAQLVEMGAAGCVVLGEPDYYGRFGFRVVEGLIYPDVPAQYFQALSFKERFPKGAVVYHEAFSAQG